MTEAETERRIERLELVLGTLIAWLQRELGPANAAKLLDKLQKEIGP